MINVLWIDDESTKEEYGIYHQEAKKNGINLCAYEYNDEGFKELEDNYNYYHAIILDILSKNDRRQNIHKSHFGDMMGEISRIQGRHFFQQPYFFFSGQVGIGGEANHLRKEIDKIYMKNEDDQELWDAIKDQHEKSIYNSILKRYKTELNAAELLNKEIYNRCLGIILHIEGSQTKDNPFIEMRFLIDELINYVSTVSDIKGLVKEHLIDPEDGRVKLGVIPWFFQGTYKSNYNHDKGTGDLVSHNEYWDDYIIKIVFFIINPIQAFAHKIDGSPSNKKNLKKIVWESERDNKKLQKAVSLQLFIIVEYLSSKYSH